jgi:hypothetical protein
MPVKTAQGRRYDRVNATWPAILPALTAQEAVSAAKRLYRLGMGKAFKGPFRITSGRRYTWIRHGTFVVNPERGWHHLVHDVSHVVQYFSNPSHRPHAWSHSDIEKRMAEMVITRGWLDGGLKKEPKPKPDIRRVRYERVLASIKRWETKVKRAETALNKLYTKREYYERSGV